MSDSAPEWVESQGKPINGLDITGLRLPIDAISTHLLIGITTVTPRIRFLSIRSWIIKAYSESGLPNSYDAFVDFAVRVETAIIYGALLNNRQIQQLPGVTKAIVTIDAGQDPILLERLVDQPGFNLYAGTCYNLLLGYASENKPPGLTDTRGVPLADIFEKLIKQTRFFKILKENPNIASYSRADLQELGLAIDLESIGDAERDCLLATLLPEQPAEKWESREVRRVGAYTFFLELANKLQRIPKEADIFEAALATENFLPEPLKSVLDGYLCYRVRDALAVVHEAVLGLVCRELGGHEGVVHQEKIIHTLVTADGCTTALCNLGLMTTDESLDTLGFKIFADRLSALIKNKVAVRGLVRWDGGLDESALIAKILKNKDMATGLMPVIWLLCRYRVKEESTEVTSYLKLLFQAGTARFGLREIIFPQVDAWFSTNTPLAEVIAWLVQRTVDQHLRIAWARMFADMSKDVAILLVDGNTWQHREKSYQGDQMASRIPDAINWLRQLQLVDVNGLTDKGKEVRKRGYGILSAFGGEA